MSWVRELSEAPVRRPTDVAKVVVGAIAFCLVAAWAHAQTEIDASFFAPLNQMTDGLEGASKVVYALGSPWVVLVIAVAFLALRHVDVALRAAAAGLVAWGVSELFHELLGGHPASSLGVDVRLGDGPVFPALNVALATALLVAVAPHLVRPLRRILVFVVLGVAFTTMYLGVGLPSDVLGGLLLGATSAALVALAIGTPSGKPSLAEVRDALSGIGLEPTDLRASRLVVTNAALVDADLDSGTVRVDALGRDQRDARLAAKAWRRAMFKEPGTSVLGSRAQQVEHVGFATLLATRGGACVPELVTTGNGGADVALLVTRTPAGTPLADAPEGGIDDADLRAAWRELGMLHDAGVTHGNLDLERVLVTGDGSVAFDDLGAAGVRPDQYWFDRDCVALLTDTALVVGHERAIGAAVEVAGTERIGALIPVLQPAALPPGVGRGTKHLAKDLKALRAYVAEATGAEDASPLQIKRLTAANIGILAGVLVALAIAIPSLEGIDWSSVQDEFENATWAWAFLALALYPLVPTSWATALLGCVNADLRFVPTVLVQLACSFLNLITPNGIGGTALQLDYLHKQGVPVASGGSAMVLSTGVGGAIQIVLFLIAAALSATALDDYDLGGGSASLWAIALGAAAIGIVLFIPKIRGKVVPAVIRAAKDIWSVLRTPKKALQLFGGDLGGNLIYPALLGICLLAFHDSLGFAQLVVVQIGAGMLGNVAPVPGGIGVQEAALTAGLTGFGIDANTALATVILFRGITFAVPPVFGFFTLRWLRKKGYA